MIEQALENWTAVSQVDYVRQAETVFQRTVNQVLKIVLVKETHLLEAVLRLEGTVIQKIVIPKSTIVLEAAQRQKVVTVTLTTVLFVTVLRPLNYLVLNFSVCLMGSMYPTIHVSQPTVALSPVSPVK